MEVEALLEAEADDDDESGSNGLLSLLLFLLCHWNIVLRRLHSMHE